MGFAGYLYQQLPSRGPITIEKIICNGSKLLSVLVSEPLLILESLLMIGISNGSYSKITYSYNSHTTHNLHTSSYIVTNHIQTHIQVHKRNKHRYNYI
jgi:hypothetical protein